jgi:hypothetical protein
VKIPIIEDVERRRRRCTDVLISDVVPVTVGRAVAAEVRAAAARTSW